MAEYVTDPERPHLGGNVPGGDEWTYYPKLWDWMAHRQWPVGHGTFTIWTIFDVGCGEGQTGLYFNDELRAFCIGLEGLEVNAEKCRGPVIVHDLTTGPVILTGIDLVWCCEVVEHIEERHIDHLLKTITCGRLLAMTHGLPQQHGYHHVNLQPDDYWIERVERYGMKYLRDETKHSRTLAPGHWERSGLIFGRAEE